MSIVKKYSWCFLLIFFQLLHSYAIAQTKRDSLELQEIFDKFLKAEYVDSAGARIYALKGLHFAQNKFPGRPSEGKACMYYGWYLQDISKYQAALKYFERSFHIFNKYNLRQEIADAWSNLGNIYQDMDNLPVSLNYHMKSARENQRILKSEKDPQKIKRAQNGYSASTGNIGTLYNRAGNYEKGMSYQLEALEYDIKSGNRENLSAGYNNLGVTCRQLKRFDECTMYYRKSLKIAVEENNLSLITSNYISFGVLYDDLHMLDSALFYYNKGYEIALQLGDQSFLANINGNLGEIYRQKKEYKKAEEHLFKGIEIATRIKLVNDLRNHYRGLTSLYKDWGKPEEALEAYKKHILYRDSILNENKSDQIARAEVKFMYEKQLLQDSLQRAEDLQRTEIQREKEKFETDAKLKRQKTYILFAAIGFLFMLVIAFLMFRSSRSKKRAHEIISQQKQKVEHQKAMIEEKHKEISDSINYAKRIQNALLTSEDHWSNIDEHFILFKPKDIVSGDFYWSFGNGENFIWCAADCTGHGVPGAFMSMLGISFLNEIVVDKNISSTASALNLLRKKIIRSMEQKNVDVQQQDGMDISLCAWNKKTNELEYSGANNPLWIIRNNECLEFVPDKMPVGRYTGEEKPFSSQKVQLEKNDLVFVFTDGFADQFGGEKGKKYKYLNLKKKLLEVSALKLNEQKLILENEFERWKGNYEQLDDVCIIGVRI